MEYSWDFNFLWGYRELILKGLALTVAFTFGTIALGMIVGLFVGLGRLSRLAVVRWPLTGYVEVFRCTPLLVQLVWFYYALPVLLGVEITATMAATLALSLYVGSFYAEIFRGGVASVDPGQWDAARALGHTWAQTMRRIVLPQAVKNMLPAIMNQNVIQLKNTSLISTVAVADLLYQGAIITAATYRPLEVYTLVAVLYFTVLFPLTRLAVFVERRLATQ